ncbi:MAG TPA: hypothetical protein VGN29_09145 [Solirubrobacteraceae bacterium]|nr:hypothetical protein [Solirubrobacteraceae bacterium]
MARSSPRGLGAEGAIETPAPPSARWRSGAAAMGQRRRFADREPDAAARLAGARVLAGARTDRTHAGEVVPNLSGSRGELTTSIDFGT